MQKKLWAITFILSIAITTLTLLPTSSAASISETPQQITINSPLPQTVCSYKNISIPVQVEVKEPIGSDDNAEVNSIRYNLDGVVFAEFAKVEVSEKQVLGDEYNLFSASAFLYNLEDGNHTLSVYCTDSSGRQFRAVRNFAVNSSEFSNLTQTASSSPLPKEVKIPLDYTLIAGLVWLASVSAAGFLVYVKVRKTKNK